MDIAACEVRKIVKQLENMSASLQDTCFTFMLMWHEHVPSVTCCAIKFKANFIYSDAVVLFWP